MTDQQDFTKPHAIAEKIVGTIRTLNAYIAEGSAHSVQVTLFTESHEGVPRVYADVAVLHGQVRSVHSRQTQVIEADPEFAG